MKLTCIGSVSCPIDVIYIRNFFTDIKKQCIFVIIIRIVNNIRRYAD